ncbi:acyl-CoA dehydrogenase family protein [Acidobacteriota bacterium]
MIDFEMTEEQVALKEMAHEFALKEMRPHSAHFDQVDELPHEIMQKAFDTGFFTCEIPEEYGGGGLSHLETTIVSEELSWGCPGMYTTIMASSLGQTPIILFGTEEQKMKFLKPLTEKLGIVGFCLTEREAGSDAGSLKTKAIRDGDDYVINGSKCFITNGGIASLYTVFALTDPKKGPRGMSAFIVPRDTPGISIGKEEDKMGHRASNTTEVIFDDVRVPAENILKKEGFGFLVCMRTLDQTRASVGAGGVGLARAALEHLIDYTKTRVQFGKPLALFQNTSFEIARMATKVNAARHLVRHAAWLLDQGKPCGKESAMAKCFGSDTAMQVSLDALQLFGGYGYMRDYPIEKLVRDAKLLQIYEGTNQIQLMVIAREVIGPIK